MAKILVIGAYGQLGSELKDLSDNYPQHQFLFVDRDQLDITDETAVQESFANFAPDFCVNCAAYTAVDKAETEQETAFAINATAVRYLAKACKDYNAKLVHISTDYVFDGTASEPYVETDAPNPLGVYGQSKWEGEEEALRHNTDTIVIRTSWVYSAHGNNFVKTMLRLMQSKPEINVVADQQGSPTYARDLADAILQIINGDQWEPGIYHYTNEGNITWFQFAMAIKELTQSPCIVHPITTDQYPTPAKRPQYSVLDKQKIQNTFSLSLRPWKESLQQCLVALGAL